MFAPNTATATDSLLSFADALGYGVSVKASTVDAAGSVYIAGSTIGGAVRVSSNAFQPVFAKTVCGDYPGPHGSPGQTVPCEHGFVAKTDATGTRLLYATYLGGTSQDYVNSIAVDSTGNVYVAGFTSSSDFPVTAGAYRTSGSGFITKLSSDGSTAIYSTHLPSLATAVAVDRDGAAYVTGPAGEFPTTPGAFQSKNAGRADVFVVKLNPDGAGVQYSTLIGGTFDDVSAAIAVDVAGNAYVGGYTASTPYYSFLAGSDYALFPTTAGAFGPAGGQADVFITKLNASGSSLIFSAVFGGSGYDQLNALTVDAGGAVYFAGNTPFSPDFPVTSGAIQETYGGGFVGKMSPDGKRLLYCTYLGADRPDSVSMLAIDRDGDALVSGTVYRANFPTTPDADRCVTASQFGFVPRQFYAKLNPTGSALLYATYVASVIAIDSSGHFFSKAEDQVLRRNDTFAPVSGLQCIANAASFQEAPIAPGEIISLLGPGIGPEQPISAQPNASGAFPKTLSGVGVLINGEPVPILYASGDQINAIVPFSLDTSNRATVQIVGKSPQLSSLSVAVSATAPAAFARDGSGFGQIAAVNQDGSLNGATQPAPQGSIVSLWLTGFGRMQPTPVDGRISTGTTSKTATQPIVRVGPSEPVEVLYCGEAPGLVEGVVQMNIRIPRLLQPGQMPVYVDFGGIFLHNAPLMTISVQ